MFAAAGFDVARYRCFAGPRERPYDEEHQTFAISFVERGVFSYRGPRGTSVLGPGWLMLAKEGEPYVCSHEHNDGSGDSCLVLSFPLEALEPLRSTLGHACGPNGPFPRAVAASTPRVFARFAELAAAGDEGFARAEACLAAAAAVLAESAEISALQSLVADDRAHAAARFIERHAADPLTLDAVAAEVGLSAFHFVRVFRAALGLTPHQYLIRVRLLRAIDLLRNTALEVTEVAYEAGWGDLSTFNRTFRRDLGCTPLELRRGRSSHPAPR
jgi:AraC-like DNA-binding protein